MNQPSAFTRALLVTFVSLGAAHAAQAATIDSCREITASGSYRLTTDVSANGVSCFRIKTSNVILDLGGRTLRGNANGSYGVELGSTYGAIVNNVRVEDNFGFGIRTGPAAVINTNTVSRNIAFGISAGVASEVEHNVVRSNKRWGIATGSASVLGHNTVEYNGESEIIVGYPAFVPEAVTISKNEVNSNGSDGIQVQCPATVSANDVWSNGWDLSKGGGVPIASYGGGCSLIGNIAF